MSPTEAGHRGSLPAIPPTSMVVIASAGHSGSTLLDLLLGNHSEISSAGEMNRLTLYPEDRRCACGATVNVCPYWSMVRLRLADGLGGERLRWDECPTDLEPLAPVLQLDDGPELKFESDTAPPERLARGLSSAGISLSASARLTYGGVRDTKWRITDEGTGRSFVVRRGDGRVKVYPPLVEWKNPLRRLPSLLELALAAGGDRSVRFLGKLSRKSARHMEAAENSWRVADAMTAEDGTQFVLDSSKSAVRLKLLYLVRPERLRVVHLVRDGRAVSASSMRRRNVTARVAARVWKRENDHLSLLLRGIPASQVCRTRYEDVCADPAAELARICRFLGIDFEPAMTRLWDRPVHNIPGNPMLFQKDRRDISLDERWRRDLSAEDRLAIEAVAGRLNRAFGYS